MPDLKSRIKLAGRNGVRIIPEDLNDPHGKQTIKIFENNIWHVLMDSVDKKRAENLVSESINRVILG